MLMAQSKAVTTVHFHRHFIAQEVSVAWDEERAVVLRSTQHACARAVRHAVELGHVVVAVARRVEYPLSSER